MEHLYRLVKLTQRKRTFLILCLLVEGLQGCITKHTTHNTQHMDNSLDGAEGG
jgi:hypothetical protein